MRTRRERAQRAGGHHLALTLGQVLLVDEDVAASPLLPPGKPLALVIYLALAPRHSATRSHLIDLLWADADPDHARQTLRQTLWQIRRALGEEAITSDGDTLLLTAPLDVDRDRFLAAVEAGRFDDATALYAGPFLPDLALPGGAEFEHWADLERARLHSAFVHALESLTRAHLQAGRWSAAQAAARRLRDADPEREAAWRLLLEAALSSGDHLSATLEADALERFAAAEHRELEPATRRLLRLARQEPAPASPDEPRRLATELIGREAEFASVLEAWEKTRAGSAQVVRVVAPAGLGKTRLLDEVRNRLRAAGASVAYARAHPGERHLSLAFAASVAEAVAPLPGAAGVSTDAASALVALSPSLSSWYPAPADRASGADAQRRRAIALADLLHAVADNAPVALLLDDLHWADADSRQALDTALARTAGARLLTVWTERPTGESALVTAATRTLALTPLTEDQCTAFLGGLAALPRDEWVTAAVRAMGNTTGGSPLHLLETLQYALANGWLTIRDGAWHCDDPAGVADRLASENALDRRVRGLAAPARELLLALSVAGRPLAVDDRTLLPELERLGFVRPVGEAWEVAHDEIGDAVRRVCGLEAVAEAHIRRGDALLRAPGPAAGDFRLAAAHFLEAGHDGALPAVFARWLQYAARAQDRRSDRALAVALLGADRPDLVKRLLASRPLYRRIGVRRPTTAVIGVAAALVVLVAARGVLAARPRPVRLALVQSPVSAQVGLFPNPVVEIEDAAGDRVFTAHDTVHAAIAAGGGRLEGATAVVAESGRATFADLQLDSATLPVTLRFSAAHLAPALVTLKRYDALPPRLRLLSGTLNGQTLSPGHDTVRVSAGQSIHGTLTLRYWSYWGAAAVMLGATPTWGDPRSAFVTLAPLPTPAEDRGLTEPIILPGPTRPGAYHIVIFFGAEPDVKWIASGTNWVVGHPLWGDGNDVAEWTARQLAQARVRGVVETTIMRSGGRAGNVVPAAVIDVEVR